MNDVLPKPFTKEGLLSMLEKHLSHLKKSSHPGSGLEPPSLPAGLSTGSMSAPTSMPMIAGRAPGQPSSHPSLKDEITPGNSPATVSTNWNSPMQPSGMSPVPTSAMNPEEYMNVVGRYPAYPGMEGQVGAPMQMPVPSGAAYAPMAGAPRGGMPGPPRRGIEQISGGPGVANGDGKRQQIYAPVPPMGQGRQ